MSEAIVLYDLRKENDRLRAAANCDSCGKPFDENGGICEPCHSAAIVAHIKPIAAERDSLRAELEKWNSGELVWAGSTHPRININDAKAEIDRLRAQITELVNHPRLVPVVDTAEIDRLRAALLEYGGHQHSCRRNMYPLLEPKMCDCGWAEFFIKYSRRGNDQLAKSRT